MTYILVEDPTSYQFHHITPGGCTQLQNRWFEVMFKRENGGNGDLCSYHRGLSIHSEEVQRPRSGAFFIPSNQRGLKQEKLQKIAVSKGYAGVGNICFCLRSYCFCKVDVGYSVRYNSSLKQFFTLCGILATQCAPW